MEAGLLSLLVAIVAGTVLLLVTRSDNNAPTVPTTSTLPIRNPADPAELLNAWERSHIGPFVQTGVITRTRGDELEVTGVRRAVKDGLSLNQVGSTAIVIEGGQQLVCEVFDADDIQCGGAEAAPTPADRRDELAAELVPDGNYLAFTDPTAGCFLLVFDGAVALGSRFGQETLLCFDETTGALVSSVERTGVSVETLETETLSSEVINGDLRPSGLE